MSVCTRPAVPSCGCSVKTKLGVTVCPKPFSADDTCADARTAYSGPGKKPGDPCRGWLDEGKPPGLPSEGVLDCDMCYGDARLGQGVPGAACRGMHKDGNMYDGKWSCE